jgi:hypothetical protein
MEPKQERSAALHYALERYKQNLRQRSYNLPDEPKQVLAAIAKAVLTRRSLGEIDSAAGDELLERMYKRLDEAGVNIFQQRPGDAPKVPELWRDRVTNQALPSPFDLPDSERLKAMNVLSKHDPELLAHFQAMKADPYGHIAHLREEEAERAALSKIAYGAKEHVTNPFVGDNQTAQAELMKRDKRLAEFYQREAVPVAINIFRGKSQNLTHRSLAAKGDPEIAATLALAEKIHSQWRAEDKAEAERQAAEAQARLEALAKEAADEGRSQLRIA